MTINPFASQLRIRIFLSLCWQIQNTNCKNTQYKLQKYKSQNMLLSTHPKFNARQLNIVCAKIVMMRPVISETFSKEHKA